MAICNPIDASSSIPLGVIMPAAEYAGVDRRVRGIVLEQVVGFNPLHYVKARRSFFDVSVIRGPQMFMLLFTLQIADARLIWLADPCEPAVWDAIDSWNANSSVSIAMSRKQTHMFVIPCPTTSDETINLLRGLKGQPGSDLFTQQAIEALSGGLLDDYEIPGIPKAARSTACLLHTAVVDRALKRQGYEARYDLDANTFCAHKLMATAHISAASMH
ncbi:hypothetical protein [Paraburkholderia sp. Cpub6]|uniref:hypothetical protein n=1 Tax=Paraburkholderia sp. Cpub6 TaxID=2723094 RepID=UPI001622DE8F|nr:hypothetical protein [Paraburkholderia sp. Cpub6]MBB5462337.1 hypothetical protein [Paraburkholderia sp. Cpub6]